MRRRGRALGGIDEWPSRECRSASVRVPSALAGDNVHVGTNDGPYRSHDAGDHWERLGFPERGAVVWALAFHPTRPEIMYAGLAPVGVYRSENGGDTWRKLPGAVDTGHCPMGFPTRALGIAVDPGRPDDVYVALEVSGVIHSRDGGETWTDLSAPLIKLSEQPHLRSRLCSSTDASGMLDSHAITISAARPGRAVLGVRMGLFATEDHGATWYDIPDRTLFTAHLLPRRDRLPARPAGDVCRLLCFVSRRRGFGPSQR